MQVHRLQALTGGLQVIHQGIGPDFVRWKWHRISYKVLGQVRHDMHLCCHLATQHLMLALLPTLSQHKFSIACSMGFYIAIASDPKRQWEDPTVGRREKELMSL